MGKAIKWAYRYGRLGAVVYADLGEAIEAALDASENGDESLLCIEHDGERIDSGHPAYERAQARREAEWDAQLSQPTIATVDAIPPNGVGWVRLGGFDDFENARVYADDMASVLGADRVRISPFNP